MTEFPDWQTAVNVVDRAIPLWGGDAPGGPIVANGANIFLNTSKVNTLFCSFSTPAAAGTNYYNLGINWSEGSFGAGTDTVSFHNTQSYSLTSGLVLSVPVRGSGASFLLYGTANSSMGLVIVGSTRSVGNLRIDRIGDVGGKLAESVALNIPASGGTQTIHLPPVERAYALDVSTGLASGLIDVRPIRQPPAGTPGTARSQLFVPNATTGLVVPELILPAMGTDIVVTNNDAVVRVGTFAAWDVS